MAGVYDESKHVRDENGRFTYGKVEGLVVDVKTGYTDGQKVIGPRIKITTHAIASPGPKSIKAANKALRKPLPKAPSGQTFKGNSLPYKTGYVSAGVVAGAPNIARAGAKAYVGTKVIGGTHGVIALKKGAGFAPKPGGLGTHGSFPYPKGFKP